MSNQNETMRKLLNVVESAFDPRKHEMTPEGIEQMAENALNAAALSIQDELGVETGDAAGIFFSGEHEKAIKKILIDYINFELMHHPLNDSE